MGGVGRDPVFVTSDSATDVSLTLDAAEGIDVALGVQSRTTR